MTRYNDAAWVIGHRDRDEFDRRFGRIVVDLMITAWLYRRMARLARRQWDVALFRHLAIKAMHLRSSATYSASIVS